MARNAEKAMTALARWRRMKEEEERGPVAKRPSDVMECTSLNDAERYRRQITTEICKKITAIQNPGLGEFKIRDLNDEINKLLRVKYAWEIRIKGLGGPDYRHHSRKEIDRDGREVAGNRGYKYFGAAKDLPGVRELFQRTEPDLARKTRIELMKRVGTDYYGYMDDDDGLLIPLENDEEVKARAQLTQDWEQNKDAWKTKKAFDDDIDIYRLDQDSDDGLDTTETVHIGEDGQLTFVQHVVVPSQKEIEASILRRKKALLYDKFLPNLPESDHEV